MKFLGRVAGRLIYVLRGATFSALLTSKYLRKKQDMAKQLNPGDAFPNYGVPLVSGGTLTIPADIKGEYAVIIFYRGIW